MNVSDWKQAFKTTYTSVWFLSLNHPVNVSCLQTQYASRITFVLHILLQEECLPGVQNSIK